MSTALDEDLVILESLDFDPTCELAILGCDAKAEWVLTVLCCNKEYNGCNDHHDKVIRHVERHPHVYCEACGFSWNTKELDNIKWTRL